MGYPLTLLLLHLFIIVFCHDAFLRFLRTCGIFVELSNIQGSSAIHRGVCLLESPTLKGECQKTDHFYINLCANCAKSKIYSAFSYIKLS